MESLVFNFIHLFWSEKVLVNNDTTPYKHN